MIAHHDFDERFILLVDASLDRLGAVLSPVTKGESKDRLICFCKQDLKGVTMEVPSSQTRAHGIGGECLPEVRLLDKEP